MGGECGEEESGGGVLQLRRDGALQDTVSLRTGVGDDAQWTTVLSLWRSRPHPGPLSQQTPSLPLLLLWCRRPPLPRMPQPPFVPHPLSSLSPTFPSPAPCETEI